jgi:cystathionine beta-lyase/cystathionine gamma-synthase
VDFETRAIHAGQEPDPTTGAVATPIYQTSTFAQEAVGVNKGYDYARVANPTRTALEDCLASLEEADFGLAFSSGLGAATSIMHLVDPGDRVVCVNDVYGGMYRMFSQVYEPKGYLFDYVTPEQLLEPGRLEGARLVWVESPTNPLLNIVDLAAVAALTRAAGAVLVVDNTFATPYLQTPLPLGADIVVHSTTKYLNGHSDVIGGVAIVGGDDRQAEWRERLVFLQNAVGAIAGPFDSFLALRGLKATHEARMRFHPSIALWDKPQDHGGMIVHQGPAMVGIGRGEVSARDHRYRRGFWVMSDKFASANVGNWSMPRGFIAHHAQSACPQWQLDA